MLSSSYEEITYDIYINRTNPVRQIIVVCRLSSTSRLIDVPREESGELLSIYMNILKLAYW